jgi:hypothetical protein
MEKTCNKCNDLKPDERFYKKEKIRKDCKAKYKNEWRKKNPEKTKEALKKWYNNTGKEWKKQYETNNKDSINQRDKDKYHNDPVYRNKKILRTRLLSTINGTRKYTKILEKLHIEHGVLLNWLEYQFSDDMSWENQGEYWGIDHIIPIDYFVKNNLNEDESIHHWSNLRPCKNKGPEGNFSKNNKIVINLIKNHFSYTVPSFAKSIGLELDDIVQRLQRKWAEEDNLSLKA